MITHQIMITDFPNQVLNDLPPNLQQGSSTMTLPCTILYLSHVELKLYARHGYDQHQISWLTWGSVDIHRTFITVLLVMFYHDIWGFCGYVASIFVDFSAPKRNVWSWNWHVLDLHCPLSAYGMLEILPTIWRLLVPIPGTLFPRMSEYQHLSICSLINHACI